MNILFGYYGAYAQRIKSEWLSLLSAWADQIFNTSSFDEDEYFHCFISGIFQKEQGGIALNNCIIDGCLIYEGIPYSMFHANRQCVDLSITNLYSKSNGNFTLIKKNYDELVVANDYNGTKPFYYYKNKNGLFFANDLRILILYPSVPFSINRTACELFCTAQLSVDDNALEGETFFKDIFKLPPASIMYYQNNEIQIMCYYPLDKLYTGPYLILDDLNEYYGRFRCLLNKASSSMLLSSASNNISISLSGGLDSANVLASLVDMGFSKRITCYHMSYKDLTMYQSNDQHIVKELVKKMGVKGCIIYGDDCMRINNCELGRDHMITVDGPSVFGNSSFYINVAALMQRSNSELLYGGDGGDYMFMGTKYAAEYLLRNRMYIEAIRRARILAKESFMNVIKSNLRYNILPFLPYISNIAYREIFWSDVTQVPSPPYLSNKIKLLNSKYKHEQQKLLSKSKYFRDWNRRFICDFIFPRGGYIDVKIDGLEFVQPIMDRTIFEFVLAVPPTVNYNIYEGENNYIARKKILRNAYADILPLSITQQKEKTLYGGMIRTTLINEKKHLLEMFNNKKRLYIAELELVDQALFCDRIRTVLSLAKDPHYFANEESRYYMNIINLEIWLKLFHMGRDRFLKMAKLKYHSVDSAVESI